MIVELLQEKDRLLRAMCHSTPIYELIVKETTTQFELQVEKFVNETFIQSRDYVYQQDDTTLNLPIS